MHTKTKKPVLLLPAPSPRIHYAFEGLQRWAKHAVTPKHIVLVVGISLGMVVGGLAISFFWPRTVNLSYSGDSCFTQPTILPRLVSKTKSAGYAARPISSISIAGYPLYSHTTCIKPTAAPTAHTSEVIAFGTGFLVKKITISTGALPSIAGMDALQAPISARKPLVLQLSTADDIFAYRVLANGQGQDCVKHNSVLSCDITPLGLAQSTAYDLNIERLFAGKSAGTLLTDTITTVKAVEIVGTSIAAEQVVYDVPTELTLTFSRPATALEDAHLYQVTGSSRQEITITAEVSGQTAIIRFAQPLVRGASFVLAVGSVTASDGGFLQSPFSLPFKTSVGPKVLGVSIGSYKVATNSSVTITFDSPISQAQIISDFVRIEASGAPVASTVNVNGNTVTIQPQAALPRCAALRVFVKDGLQNRFGVAGGSAWQYNSRTICQTVFSIGTSVQGRGLTAYRFGNGPSAVVFVGGTHGNEQSSVSTLTSWLDYLERNYDSIPVSRSIIVIPNLNPDGYASNRRTNANNVDLNRNFPANDWKQGVTMPDGSYNANGGGNYPLSEPEPYALASYLTNLNPRLVLTYHSSAGVVLPNDAGDSDALAQVYDQKSSVYYHPASQDTTIFAYDITGSMEGWLYDQRGTPALLIELWTDYTNEFARHQAALWYMATLP